MKKMCIYYGSTTGTCEEIAGKIAVALGLASSDVKNASQLDASAADYDVLILGTSTWGFGDVQDDWFSALDTLKSLNLAGKTVAIFGCGDAEGYPDSFCSGMKAIYDAAAATGATILTGAPVANYKFGSSDAVMGDHFIGFPVDQSNEPQKTDERLAPMIEALKNL